MRGARMGIPLMAKMSSSSTRSVMSTISSASSTSSLSSTLSPLPSASDKTLASKKLLFILDLNGTLLHRVTQHSERLQARSHPHFKSPDTVINGCPVYFRPGHRRFLAKLFELGEVAVWTSAMSRNAIPMVQEVFCGIFDVPLQEHSSSSSSSVATESINYTSTNPSIKKRLLFVWSQEQCEARRIPGQAKPDFRKDLNKVWTIYPQFDASTTIMIDDSINKLSYNPNNLLCIPEFVVTNHQINHHNDVILSKLSSYLQVLCAAHYPLTFLVEKPFEISNVYKVSNDSSESLESVISQLEKTVISTL